MNKKLFAKPEMELINVLDEIVATSGIFFYDGTGEIGEYDSESDRIILF